MEQIQMFALNAALTRIAAGENWGVGIITLEESDRIVQSFIWYLFDKPSSWPRKPSWAEIIQAHTYLQAQDQADRYINGSDDRSGDDGLDWGGAGKLGEDWRGPPNLIDVTRRINWLADQKAGEPVDHSGHTDKLHIGGGVDHMTSLVQLAESATVAGQHIPRMVVRSEAAENVDLYLDDEAREMVTLASFQKNRAQSAKNIVRNKLDAARKIIEDPHGGLAEPATKHTPVSYTHLTLPTILLV